MSNQSPIGGVRGPKKKKKNGRVYWTRSRRGLKDEQGSRARQR